MEVKFTKRDWVDCKDSFRLDLPAKDFDKKLKDFSKYDVLIFDSENPEEAEVEFKVVGSVIQLELYKEPDLRFNGRVVLKPKKGAGYG